MAPPAGDESDDGSAPGSSDKDGPVLGPEELDIERRENVVEIDEGRFVIASDEDSARRAATLAEERAERGEATEHAGTERGSTENPPDPRELDAQTVRDWQVDALASVGSYYGFQLTAKTQQGVNHHQMYSDDVGTVFDGLLLWYAQQLDRETPVEDVLGILLTESNVRIRFPLRTLHQFIVAQDLGPDDSIRDLLQAVSDRDGVVFPPDEGRISFDSN